MYIGKWPPEFKQLPRMTRRLSGNPALSAVTPALVFLSPISALFAKKKEAEPGLSGNGTMTPGGTRHPEDFPKGVQIAIGVVSVGSMAASAYHGYKRNNSVGWAVWWGFMGGLFPIITPVIALAQGFGKPIAKEKAATA